MNFKYLIDTSKIHKISTITFNLTNGTQLNVVMLYLILVLLIQHWNTSRCNNNTPPDIFLCCNCGNTKLMWHHLKLFEI